MNERNGWDNFETWITYTYLTDDQNIYNRITAMDSVSGMQSAAHNAVLEMRHRKAPQSGLIADLINSAIENIDFHEIALAIWREIYGNDALFKIGQIAITPGAQQVIDNAGDDITRFIARHVMGDWGNVPKKDKQANDDSVINGGRLLSVYDLLDGITIWIITERSRQSTTVLLPSEY